jgi:hypothetical protein
MGIFVLISVKKCWLHFAQQLTRNWPGSNFANWEVEFHLATIFAQQQPLSTTSVLEINPWSKILMSMLRRNE